MKKALSLALVVLMVVGIFASFAINSSADGETSIYPYANGMENWTGSPNKTDANPQVTQILICVDPWDGSYYKPGFEMTITMEAVDGSSKDTFTAKAATTYDGGSWGICRYEPCLMKKPWVPVKDKHYFVTASFTDVNGQKVTLQAVEYDDDGAVVGPAEYFLDLDPIVPAKAPKAGEGTAAIIVLGTIALLGTAVVVSKKVFAR